MQAALKTGTRRIVSVATTPERFRLIEEAAGDSGWDLRLLNSGEEPANVQNELLILDTEVARSGAASSWVQGAREIILLSVQPDADAAIDALQACPKAHHIVPLTGDHAGERLAEVLDRIDSPAAWGITGYPLSADAQQRRIDRFGDKSALLESLRTYCLGMEAFRELPETALTVASELIMNAVFDAPVDRESGTRKYAHLPRAQDIALLAGERVDVCFGRVDGDLTLAVRDPFGTLDRATIVDNLYRCRQRGRDQIRQAPGGAGVGLYLIFHLCTQLDIYIRPMQSTEIVARISASKKKKDYEERGRAINIYCERA